MAKLLDTYSLGLLIPSMLVKNAKKFNKLSQFKTLLNDKNIEPFIQLFKSMSEPNCFERLTPAESYKKYLELEKLYLNKETNNKKYRRVL